MLAKPLAVYTHLSATVSQLFEPQVQKIAIFSRTAAHIFFCQITLTSCFLWRRPLRLSRNMLHGWKDNSMLAKHLVACTHLSSIVSELFEPQV